MKKAKELLHLPVICIANGKQLGIIKDLLINPDESLVHYLIIGQDDWQVQFQALSYDEVTGVGEFAVMVENQASILGLDDIPYLNKMVSLIGSQVITTGGEHSGTISDYFFNLEDGKLESLLIQSANNKLLLPIENVLFLGKERVITNNSLAQIETELEVEEQVEEITGNKNPKKEALKNLLNDLIQNELPKLGRVNNETEQTLTNESED
ncbi:PRC-barrel domain-containing protein [Bacillus weihaiensis]|uniref:PRC-barrel domain-containing protein n=1 Tax=Bacillus weihaiensis TaxID=1547283 RepID=UPI002352D190|nr:PRC-barrel domain-containing protein [Bacillus weihaiensis]